MLALSAECFMDASGILDRMAPIKLAQEHLRFSRKGRGDIETVQGKFAFQYPNAKKISLMDRETWKNKDYSLSQPPSSKQDDRKGVDSNLAGTKEKIAQLAHHSDEHLQGPRPMQSSNANTVVPAVAPDAEKNSGDQPRGREINRSDVLTPKPVESPKPSNFHRRVMSQIRDFFNADKNGGDQARGREINRSDVLTPKPVESPTPSNSHRLVMSQIRELSKVSGQSDERRLVRAANRSPTPTPRKGLPPQ
ncbi:hypothetical protein BS47DRAFT_614024 [Hydnum rufescens UP504]|uniref:Uncharacterized protein n=1 Tax=Hydnum rufescens UP504 TaxID=1448309 RepID=A0A9P6DJX5_9AGAM|nr:hypothetical protein BS47DRAFT_614024 [Hydnum rufescens UP504]